MRRYSNIMNVSKELLELGRVLFSLPQKMLFGWVIYVIRLLRDREKRDQSRHDMRGGERGQSRTRCMPISDKVYRRPDPTIYSQSYLITQGIAVTWDNPDIQLWRDDLPISSQALDPDTDYEVVARVWNNSIDAPAIHLPVKFSFLDFGIGAVPIPIGEATVNLPVKGAPGHPAFAGMAWHTPSKPGHYCLLVELIWADDANPLNNLGQENTNVRPLNTLNVQYRFPVHNQTKETRVLRLEVDAYEIPLLQPCVEKRRSITAEMTKNEIEEHRREVITLNGRQNFPVPTGWQVNLSQTKLVLSAEELHMLTVDMTAPEDFHGRQAFNINAFDGKMLVGGVTLYAMR
jgi:hypothetical protein